MCITLCTGLWANAQQNKISSELVRLHVLAQSDSPDDQAVKLEVRDAILVYLTPKIEDASSVTEADEIIRANLSAIESLSTKIAVAEGKPYTASASLQRESYARRDYDTFSLPSGDYLSLKISLGTAKGENWWCVVFPPLCLNSVESEEAFEELPEDSAEIIRTVDGEYSLRFRIIELFERLKGL